MHVDLNFPPGQWCIKHFRCWGIISRQEQASQKMMGPLIGKGSWYSQCVQNLEQGEGAVCSLAAPELRVAFILNHDFFNIHVLNLLVLLFVIAKELFSLSFCFKHFNERKVPTLFPLCGEAGNTHSYLTVLQSQVSELHPKISAEWHCTCQQQTLAHPICMIRQTPIKEPMTWQLTLLFCAHLNLYQMLHWHQLAQQSSSEFT